jgi:hypothetical protein
VIALVRAWLAGGNHEGVTTRRLHVAAYAVNQALVVWLVLLGDAARAERFFEPLLLLIGGVLGIYMTGRTVQARTAAAPQGGGQGQ